jgi:hypothetical protein
LSDALTRTLVGAEIPSPVAGAVTVPIGSTVSPAAVPMGSSRPAKRSTLAKGGVGTPPLSTVLLLTAKTPPCGPAATSRVCCAGSAGKGWVGWRYSMWVSGRLAEITRIGSTGMPEAR